MKRRMKRRCGYKQGLKKCRPRKTHIELSEADWYGPLFFFGAALGGCASAPVATPITLKAPTDRSRCATRAGNCMLMCAVPCCSSMRAPETCANADKQTYVGDFGIFA